MTAISIQTASRTMAALFEQVSTRHQPVVIKRGNKKVMIVPMDDEGRDDTTYLMSNPVNKARIDEAIKQLNEGRGVERAIDLDS